MDHSCHRFPDTARWSRREWLARVGGGMGAWALAGLLGESARAETRPLGLPGFPHHAPKAKRVIFLFMTGGFSHLESFDPKPILKERAGENLPDSVFGGKKPLGMSALQGAMRMVGSAFPFQQHGQSGAWVSDLMPHTARMVDDLCFVKSMFSEAVNHDPALTFMQSGAPLSGRPSMGAWIHYGLGSESADLPAYICMVSNRAVDQPLTSRLWDSGFLPAHYQGVQFRSGTDPVLYLSNPKGVSPAGTRRMLDRLKALHEDELALSSQPEIEARIQQFELAFRMQASVPEATDLSREPAYVRDMYGPDVAKPGSFAANCLLARRLAERGVRFIQLFHPGWDHHGSLPEGMETGCREIDQPCFALIEDLKQRGMLDDTLVVFGSEFGRTAYSQGNASKSGNYGREHHRDCFTFWMAGGGIKPGQTYGQTCEFGFRIQENPVHVNDLHATMLHQLGINHERFTHRFQGRDFRLTDVGGKVLNDLLA